MTRIILGILFLCCTFSLSAQEFRATIEGLVTDASGAPVAGAKIAATSVGSNVPTETVSNGDGRYLISYLTPGSYVVTVEKQGFEKVVNQGVKVDVAEHATINFALTVGAVNQTVTVSANPAIIE